MQTGKIKPQIEDPDYKLVDKVKSGNSIAFGKLVKKYQLPILNLVYDYLGDYETAKDIAQDVFLKVMVNLSGFTGKAKFSTWLYRIAVNASLDEKRKIKRSRFRLFSDSEYLEKLPDSSGQSVNEIAELDGYIKNLSDQQRTAVILRFFHDKSVDEIAEIMECSSNTVRTHLYRGIDKLKKTIKTGL
jgi:RNA polymerase sigma-70 factor (ECF subfamily)